ncbi:DUF2846 domain-containing protein [Pontixanthobacter aquaemixtae]|uniref:DUF2846 domain-containing protein n=1 Tax=Pontixanthobacter aquaemixtae TaxID=1958940 RepID=A0A844ZN20_9SPHN|nr:DUF2846 domain-containing protein [Pontixanthobacter aquaemixtae]MXO89771.1 DUF2846 domain-containing protein [Pontixanthobacter aquaemixtae]
MKMTPMNIAIFGIAAIGGLIIGMQSPMLGMLLIIPVVIFVAVILLRNQSGALADAEVTADAKAMTPAAGKARIYIMRNGFVGGQQGMNITVNGDLNSQIRSKYFLMAEVDPGQHEVTAKMSSGSKSESHTFSLGAGEVILFDMKLNMGMVQGTPDFTEIRGAREAQGMFRNLKMVEWKSAA